MDSILNFMTLDFWLGLIGAFFVTGFLTQVFKQLVNKLTPGKNLSESWKPIIAVPSGFIVAVCFQLYQVAEANQALRAEGIPISFNWGIVPALTIIYAAASAYVYRFVIKKLFPKKSDNS